MQSQMIPSPWLPAALDEIVSQLALLSILQMPNVIAMLLSYQMPNVIAMLLSYQRAAGAGGDLKLWEDH